ncbi:hypothetical protein DEO72_LG10g2133 [Vigna unguiculata]|uniref:Uncharacterized protein n=1 Tax=Vigna unguiculata TaxID=3917 RepID=A0A4D6NDF2_VIGUN|nr:hypothetical protein DEO72_LG10g2133 [Vigna unguiculata]
MQQNGSQSALSETNWPLRASGCSPYLESLPGYTDGAPPWAPTNRGHGITSRPLKRDPRASHCAVSPNTSLRLRGLAQARQSRSGESPSAQARAQNQETGTTAGSRLGEIPLAWASGSLAQKLSKSPGRLIAIVRLA